MIDVEKIATTLFLSDLHAVRAAAAGVIAATLDLDLAIAGDGSGTAGKYGFLDIHERTTELRAKRQLAIARLSDVVKGLAE